MRLRFCIRRSALSLVTLSYKFQKIELFLEIKDREGLAKDDMLHHRRESILHHRRGSRSRMPPLHYHQSITAVSVHCCRCHYHCRETTLVYDHVVMTSCHHAFMPSCRHAIMPLCYHDILRTHRRSSRPPSLPNRPIIASHFSLSPFFAEIFLNSAPPRSKISLKESKCPAKYSLSKRRRVWEKTPKRRLRSNGVDCDFVDDVDAQTDDADDDDDS